MTDFPDSVQYRRQMIQAFIDRRDVHGAEYEWAQLAFVLMLWIRDHADESMIVRLAAAEALDWRAKINSLRI